MKQIDKYGNISHMSEGEFSALEVGPGQFPMLEYLRNDLQRGEHMYIERDPSFVDELNNQITSGERKGKVIKGDARNIELPENSADSILLKDVFSQQNVPFKGNVHELVDVGDVDHIIRELKRVSKENGSIVVLDTGFSNDFIGRNNLIAKFQEHGFTLKEEYDKKNITKIFNSTDPVSKIMGESIRDTAQSEAYALVFRNAV